MESTNRFNVDGIIDDELSPDFEEFEAEYLNSSYQEFEDEVEDEDLEYCKDTQDQEFYVDSDSEELDF